MSNEDIIKGWKSGESSSENNEEAPANPAGEVHLTDEDLQNVAGGDETSGAVCSAGDTYCHGTCGVPFLTYGCCDDGDDD